MKTFTTIFKKELKDSLRDRRTLLMMVIIPLLLFPILITISTKLQVRQIRKAQEKILKIGLITNGNAEAFRQTLLARTDVQIVENIQVESAEALILSDSLDAVMVFAEDFDREVSALRVGKMRLYFRSAEDRDIGKRRLLDLISDFEKSVVSGRFKKLNLDEAILKAVRVEEKDVATQKEKLGKAIGGFLPYIFVIFCYLGALYPAIDLGAGEKERGTLETLLTSPATRFQILLGKFGVVVLTGVMSAVVSIVGLFLAVRQATEIPPELLSAILGILEVKSILLVLTLLVPLTIFLAAVLLSISIYAKSFKEAQSLISPLMIVVIVPVFIGLMPGITLDTTTALIPILNVSLATKAILSGTMTAGLLSEVYVSLIIFAAASLYGCAKWFEREETIFRGS